MRPRRRHHRCGQHLKVDLYAAARWISVRPPPKVWRAPTTTAAERKSLLRLLVREVSLSPVDVPQRATRVRVLWQTGALSEVLVPRPAKGEAVVTPPDVVERVRDLTNSGHPDAEIVALLNAAGVRSGRGRALTASAVAWIRWKHHMASRVRPVVPIAKPLPGRREDGRYCVRGVAQEMGVTEHIVRYWQSRGLLIGERGRYRSWWFVLDEATRQRLAAAKARGRRPKAIPNPLHGKKVHYA